jgi:hypothetical protein
VSYRDRAIDSVYLLIVCLCRGEFKSRLGSLSTRLDGGGSSVRGSVRVIADAPQECETDGRIEGGV